MAWGWVGNFNNENTIQSVDYSLRPGLKPFDVLLPVKIQRLT